MQVRDYSELQVYRRAFDSASRIFLLSKRFPSEERYSLTDQIRRSSRSVCANIAEAWRKRRYPASFVSKLCDADADAAETEVWLSIAYQCEYLPSDVYDELRDRYKHICAQLTKMMDAPEQWCNAVGKVTTRR
jgi:four helix bundle protein